MNFYRIINWENLDETPEYILNMLGGKEEVECLLLIEGGEIKVLIDKQ